MTTETITVTAEHIAAGDPEQCKTCPIALAIRELHPDARVDVFDNTAGLILPGGTALLLARLPQEARRFIDRFDSGEPVEPFEFELTWRTDAEAAA